jgi:hypothetical protein
MREDERFVIQAVAAHCSGKWRPGENPPDAYIDMDQGTIAVEISTLSQQVTSDQGRHVRLSDDATAIRLADQLNDDMQALIPDGITVCLRLSSPIASFKKTKAQLVTIIEKMMRDGALIFIAIVPPVEAGRDRVCRSNQRPPMRGPFFFVTQRT